MAVLHSLVRGGVYTCLMAIQDSCSEGGRIELSLFVVICCSGDCRFGSRCRQALIYVSLSASVSSLLLSRACVYLASVSSLYLQETH